jgi:photosystem II stability/assembly factor-like uncharacterized protein
MSHRNYLFCLCIMGIIVLTSTVSASAPVAGFSGTPTIGPAPLTVSFTDISTGNPTGWAWYFGDEDYTEPWTQQTASAGWAPRTRHSSVALPDGSIVVTGGQTSDFYYNNEVWRSTDNGMTWTQLLPNDDWWPERYGHSSVALPDGTIVLMGGYSYGYSNEVWQSEDNGTTWTQLPNDEGWSGRYYHSSVAMPDGSIVLMGGYSSGYSNEVWRSTDNGTTWTQMTANAGWSGRYRHSSVAMPDGRIVLMGGTDANGDLQNDVWSSMDNGATWTLTTASAGWSARDLPNPVVMPDGSIVVVGGWDSVSARYNDVWRSMDLGATWTELPNAGWSARAWDTIVAMPDGSIVMMGGQDGADSSDFKNDVWRFQPAGSLIQNPSHTYTMPGTYNVALQAYNAVGYDSTLKTGYITVTESSAMGSLEVKSSPSHANIYINGVDTGKIAKWTFDDMAPGDYDVYVTLDGYTTPKTELVTVVSEQTAQLHFKLKKIK